MESNPFLFFFCLNLGHSMRIFSFTFVAMSLLRVTRMGVMSDVFLFFYHGITAFMSINQNWQANSLAIVPDQVSQVAGGISL